MAQANWLSLAHELTVAGYSVTFIDPPRSSELSFATNGSFRSWQGNISDLMPFMRNSKAVISVDSFAGHLASAVGVPTCSLFGPTNPAFWAPWGSQNLVITPPNAPSVEFARRAIERDGPTLMASLHPRFVLNQLLPWLKSLSTIKYS